MSTPKDKAKELVDKMYNTEHCGITHFPNKRYCDCTEMNIFQAKQCAIIAVDEILSFIEDDRKGFNWKEYYKEVRKEIEKL